GSLKLPFVPILGSPEAPRSPVSAGTPDGSPESAPPGPSERGKGGLEAAGWCGRGPDAAAGRRSERSPKGKRRLGAKGGLETANGGCWEQSTSGRPEAKGGLEATNGGGSEQHPSGKGRPEPKAGLETTTGSRLARGGSANGGLESAAEPEGSPEPGAALKGGPEPAAAGCPERTGEAKGQKRPSPEECAVISLGEDEDEEEEADEGPGRYLAALEAVQLELEAVEEEAARAFRRLRAKFGLRRRPHLQRRNHLIQHIPGFWVTAFLNHPQLSAMISDRDEDALSYMTSLQVEEFGPARPGCRIRFFFAGNPYFQNRVVAKEFVRGPSGG
uniref:TSYL2 protein n=1 Tax=Anser brachyrhynchus TaxID=132585 RepID=A0A8B9BSQ6_9AVES